MNRIEMGRVLAFLLQHRRMETIPRGKGRADERELARLLNDADLQARTELDGLLQGFGFDLVALDDFQTQGLAHGGKVFLLPRRLDQVSALFSERWIDERMTSAASSPVRWRNSTPCQNTARRLKRLSASSARWTRRRLFPL